MYGPLRKTISIVDNDFSPGSPDKGMLSIELLPDGFSFALLDKVLYRYHILEAFQTDKKVESAEEIIELLRSEISINPFLKEPYQQVNIAYYSNPLMLFPEHVCHRQDHEDLFRFACKVPVGHHIKADRLNNLGGYGVYMVADKLRSSLDLSFPAYQMIHAGSALIENMLATLILENQTPDMILHIRRWYFELLMVKDKKLTFYRLFPYQSFEDLLYYLFYVLQQLRLDALTMNLMLAGEISLDAERYKRLASYFKYVYFTERNDAYQYSPGFDTIPHHYYYNLLNLSSCG